MGAYLHPGRKRFEMALASEIFVDKSEMIGYLNTVINTNQRYVCVSRPRRFGKTMAADMLSAYYDQKANSRECFEKTRLSQVDSKLPWDLYLGRFDVIRIVMTDFFKTGVSVEDGIEKLQKMVIRNLMDSYPEVNYFDPKDLMQSVQDVYEKTNMQFVIIIDEWDAVFREYKEDREGQKRYLDFLRDWLKDKEYIALAYMTGILPIKKYGKHSALNMFDEYSMTLPLQMAPYAGFTEEEVNALCSQYGRDYQKIKDWYDGYVMTGIIQPDPGRQVFRETGAEPTAKRYSLYSPLSVVKAVRTGLIMNYWNETETYEALQQYIDWNFDGLKEEVAILMDGGCVKIDIAGYQNDMTTFHSKDDILTMLIHLGYLSYDRETEEVFIPNREVMDVFRASTKSREWAMTFKALMNSRKLLEATWNGDETTVADLIEAAHNKAGNRTYHSEAGLSYAIQLAYYSAQDYYTIIPELDTGKGYADLAFIPKQPSIPALLVELKYDANADTALAQIHRQKYPERLEQYKGNLILVGINYDKTIENDQALFKHHSCRIERA